MARSCPSHRLIAFAVVLGATADASAQDWALRWGATGRLDYSDNFFFTDSDEKSAFTFGLTPFMAAVRRSDTSELVALVSVGGNAVWGDPDFEYLTGRAEISGRLRSERGVWSASAGFVRSLSLQSTDVPGGFIYTLAYLNNTYAGGSYSYAVSDVWTLEARASAYDNKYDSVEGPNLLVDNYGYSAGGVANYRHDEKTFLSFATDYTYYKSDVEKNDAVTSVLGISYRYSPRIVFSGSAGYFWDERDAAPGQSGRVRSNGPLFGGEIGYDLTENTRLGVQAVQRLSPSGTGELVENDSVGVSISHRASERLRLRAGIGYGRDRSETDVEGTLRSSFFTASIGASYRIDERWTLDAGYAYTRARYQGDQGDPRSNVAFLTLAYNLPDSQLEAGLPRLGAQGVPGAGPVVPPATAAPAEGFAPNEPVFEPLLLP